MTESTKKRLFGALAICVALGALGAVSLSNIGEDLAYYWSPTELAAASNAKNATVRLGGMVVAGTYSWDHETQTVEFDVSDLKTTVHVVNKGNPPQMFREGIGVIIEGKLGEDGVFHSDKLMVSHSNEYSPPGEGETPADVYKNLTKTLEGT
jgi:cytochrome c-type biogenesis protein CcmE